MCHLIKCIKHINVTSENVCKFRYFVFGDFLDQTLPNVFLATDERSTVSFVLPSFITIGQIPSIFKNSLLFIECLTKNTAIASCVV